ncbi:MAG TPA: DUF1360 domain-containing protein [Thermoleophilaceae bacterium]|nr:DUF1360 domain-containing protein [Thermoleophilaceae bacterium]
MSDAEEGPYSGYAEPEERPPFAAYATFALVFNGALAGAVAAAKRSGRDLPERVEVQDLVLIGAASYKLSRLVAKKKITSFVRAPFTELQGRGGPAELEEKARGSGLRRAVGELLICPYCLGLWASGGFHVGLLFAPRSTRFTASVLSAMTISDFLQIAYKAVED